MKSKHYLLQFFNFKHLPENLQLISAPFATLAQDLNWPDNPESEMALRKLIEAKDCAVRAELLRVQELEAELQAGTDGKESNGLQENT